MTEHDTNLRDLAAMFAMLGLIQKIDPEMDIDEYSLANSAYNLADAMIEVRNEEPEGIAAIKKGKRNVRKRADIR